MEINPEALLGQPWDFFFYDVMAEPKTDIIQITKDFWRERTGEEISATEAQEIVDNVSNFFRILSEWDQEEKQKQAVNDESRFDPGVRM